MSNLIKVDFTNKLMGEVKNRKTTEVTLTFKVKKPTEVISKMRYLKTQNVYKSSNCLFNASNLKSTSYDWWVFSKIIGDTVLFNNTYYSSSTNKHQSKCLKLVEHYAKERGLKVLIINHYGSSLDSNNDLSNLSRIIKCYEGEISDLKETIKKPRTRKSTNERRRGEIKKLQATMRKLKKLLVKVKETELKNLERGEV